MIRKVGLKRSGGIKKTRKRRKRTALAIANEKLENLQKEIVIKTYGRDCYTCPARNLQGKNCHLGHVPWPRSVLSTSCKFDTRYTRIQCLVCNVHRGGMGAVALTRMTKEFGQEHIDAMWRLNEITKGKTHNLKWRKDKITEYKLLLTPPPEI